MTKNNLLTVLFLTLSYISIGQVQLKYSLDTNDNFTLQQEVTQIITQDIQGTSQEIENQLQGILDFTVKEKTSETTTLDVSFKTFSMKMSSPQLGTLMEIDTQAEQPTEESKMFMGLIGASITIVINQVGKIIDIQNGDAFMENMISGMGIDDAAAKEQIKKQLEKEWSGEAMGKSFEQIFYNYPTTKVSKGGTWNNEFVTKMGLSTTNTWTLAAIEKNTYKITGTAAVTINTDNDQINMSLTGTQQTDLIADAKSGLPIQLTVTSVAEGDSYSKVMANFKIPTKITSTTSYTRL